MIVGRKIKLSTIRYILDEKNPHGLRYTTRNLAKKNIPFPDDFGLRSPVIQKTFRTKISTPIISRVGRWDLSGEKRVRGPDEV